MTRKGHSIAIANRELSPAGSDLFKRRYCGRITKRGTMHEALVTEKYFN